MCDQHVLQTLRLWRFHENKRRTNVFPSGAAFVLSDTLGVTRTRSGSLCVTKSTLEFPSVFSLLARWLRCHQPASLNARFPWSNISMNYDFAPAYHRDANDTATAMTKSFGDFSGGQLLYFPEDDGALDPRKLPDTGATPVVVDTRENLCLFDGARTHGVQSFSGERYSLVFYTQQAFSSAPWASLNRIRELGAHLPDDVSTRYYEALLSPPKGYSGGKQMSIKSSLFGEEDGPQILTWRIASFNTLGNDFLDVALSFMICPTLMETLCAISHRLNQTCHRSSAWRGTVVDPTVTSARPIGARAHQHYKLWGMAKAIAVSEWQFCSCSFLIYSPYKAWKWRKPKRDCNSIWHRLDGGSQWLVASCNPVPFTNAKVVIEPQSSGAAASALVFGIADTNCVGELARMYNEQIWRLPRGPEPSEDVQLNMCCLTLANGGAVFEWNGCKTKRRRVAPISGKSTLLSFGVPEGQYVATIGAKQFAEKFKDWARAIDPEGLYYVFMIVEGECRPTFLVKPMLSTKS